LQPELRPSTCPSSSISRRDCRLACRPCDNLDNLAAFRQPVKVLDEERKNILAQTRLKVNANVGLDST
jgi:hypothetical protein